MRQATLRDIFLPCIVLVSACGSLSPLGIPICDSDDPACASGTNTDLASDANAETECADGLDNDQNGQSDCGDPACLAVCDADSDGFIAAGRGGDDCDDTKKKIHPGADESCDGIDNNCDQVIDDDSDGDGSDACEDCDNGDAAIYPGASDICGDLIDSNCDGDDCSQSWIEDFETGSLGADWVLTGAQSWNPVAVVVHEGAFAGASGTITHTQFSSMAVVVDFSQAGTLSFWHAGSTEPTYDTLALSMDGALVDEWSGSWTWEQAVYNVSAGQHTSGITYSKDASISTGSDKVWLDYIEFENGAPI